MPAREFEIQLHSRLLARDPTAAEEVASTFLPLVKKHVRFYASSRGVTDVDLINDATVTAVFDYVLRPETYDPAKSALLTYLKRASEKDLLNEIQKDRRRRHGEELEENVELSILQRNRDTEVSRIRRDTELELIHRLDSQSEALRHKQNGSTDTQLLSLIESGERKTSVFAKILNITHLSDSEQKRIVKQHKDRLKLQLKRRRRTHRERT